MSESCEVTIQTRVPDALQHALKLLALKHQVLLKEDIAQAFALFLTQQPWLTGTWVKQPKSQDFKPITVKIPLQIGSSFEQKAEEMEVSTSSLAYTAVDWYVHVVNEKLLRDTI